MKPNSRNRILAALRSSAPVTFVASALFASPDSASSATYTWDLAPGTAGAGNGTITGGAGVWDASAANWTGDAGTTNQSWPNNALTPDGATFQGTGGAVTQGGIFVNNITFATAGYSITAGTLTLSGTTPKITATADATISSVLAGTAGLIKEGAGTLSISTRATYSGNTTVNGGILSLTGGGGEPGTLVGTVNVNNGGTLRLATGDATGWGGNTARITTTNVNQGGTLNVSVTNNQTLGNSVINLTGGAITGVSGSNLDFFQGASGLNSLASPVTSTTSGAQLKIRQAAGLTMNVASGTTPSGIDLDIFSRIASDGGFATAPLVKAGAGVLRLSGANTYTGPTNINGGLLILAGTSATSDFVVTNSGSSFAVPSTGKTLKSLTVNAGTVLGLAANKTAGTTITNALTTNGAVTLRPFFTDVPAASDVYNLATAGSVAGTGTYTVDTSASGASRVSGTAAIVGNQLRMTITGAAANLIWNNNAATGVWNLNGTANFDNAGTPDVFKSFDGVTFNGTAPGTITLAGALLPGMVTVNSNAGSDYTFSGTGSLANGQLVKSGTSTLTINTSNSHSGTTINGGTVNAAAATATGSGLTTIAGGILNANVANAAGGGSLTLAGGTLNIGNATALGNAALTFNSGSFDNTSGAALSIANTQNWGGAFTFGGTQNLTTTGVATLTADSSVGVTAGQWTVGAAINGGFGVTKTGAGTLQINAGSAYSGSTIVNGGRLLVTNTLRNTSSLTVNAGATLELGATNIFTDGHGTPVLDTRVITANGGTLLMNTATDLRFGKVVLNNGATWTSNRALTNYDALMANTSAGTSGVTVGGTGTSVMNGTGGIHLQGVQNFVVNDTTSNASPDLTVSMILDQPGTIGGAAGGVNKTGTGTMVLNAANTYQGATTVNAGTLRLGAAGTLNLSDVTVNAATLELDVTGKTVKSLTVNAGSTLSFAAKKLQSSISAPTVTTAGAITLKPLFTDSPVNGDKYDLATANTTFTDGGIYTVDMTARGATRVTATAAVEAGQFLTVNIGTGAADLVWTNAASTGIWNHNTDANFLNGVTPDVFKTYDAVNFGNTGAGTVTLAGTLYPGTVTVDSSAGSNYTFAGAGSLGGGTLVKAGDSTLTVNTTNTHAATVINGGTLVMGTAGALGGGTLGFAGGTLDNGTGAAQSLPNPLVLDGNATLTGPNFTFTGGLTANEAAELTVGPNTLNLSGALLSGAGDLITKKGAGIMNITGGGTGALAGGLQIDAGTLNLNAATAAPFLTVGTGADNAVVTIDGSSQGNRLGNQATILVGSKGTLNILGVNAIPNHANSPNLTVEAGGLANLVTGTSPSTNDTISSHFHLGNLILNGGTLNLSYSGAGIAYNNESAQLNGNVIVGGSTPSSIVFGTGADATNSGLALDDDPAGHNFTVPNVTGDAAADLVIDAELENSDTGNNPLTKLGDGTLMLSGARTHTYTGMTTVSAGTLAGNSTLTGPLTVQAGATIAPGTGTATFTAAATTIAGTYACDVSGTACDKLVANGALTVSAGTLAISGTLTSPVYIIASYTGGTPAPFSDVTGLSGGYTVDYAYNNGTTSTNIAIVSGTPYTNWESTNGIAGAGANADSDGDGITNGIEFVIGGDPSGPNSDSNALLPTITIDATHLHFTFRRTEASASTNPVVQYGNSLTGWTDAQPGEPVGTAVTIDETNDGFGPGVDRVVVHIPRALASPLHRFFARLKVDL